MNGESNSGNINNNNNNNNMNEQGPYQGDISSLEGNISNGSAISIANDNNSQGSRTPILDFQNLDSNVGSQDADQTSLRVRATNSLIAQRRMHGRNVPVPAGNGTFAVPGSATERFLRGIEVRIIDRTGKMTHEDLDLIQYFQNRLRVKVKRFLTIVEVNRQRLIKEIEQNNLKLRDLTIVNRPRMALYINKLQKMRMRAIELETVELQRIRSKITELVQAYKAAMVVFSMEKVKKSDLQNPTEYYLKWLDKIDFSQHEKLTEGLQELRNYTSQLIDKFEAEDWEASNTYFEGIPNDISNITDVFFQNSQPKLVFPLHKLPSEILHLVLDRLSPRSNVVNLLTVCKLWALIIVKFLYYRPHINKKSQLDIFLRTMRMPRSAMMFDYRLMIKRLNFSFVGDYIHDKELYYFIGCRNLERLTLVFCKHITSNPVSAVLENCKFLQSVDITGIKDVQDNVFNTLSESCPRVQGFYVPMAKSVTLLALNNFFIHAPILKRVKITGNTSINDDLVSLMAEKCPLLVEVDITGSPNVHDESLIQLFLKLPQLREFRITNNSNITDKLFLELAKTVDQLPALRLVDFSNCDNITDKTIEKLVTLAPKLRNIFLGKCSRITDNSLYNLAQLGKNLQTVHFGHCFNITDQGVRVLVQSCPRIQYVDFACCTNLTNRTLYELSDLNKLKRIGLVKCSQMTDEGLLNMISLRGRNDCLERVHLSYCSNLTIYPIYELLMACPRLSHLSLTAVPSFLRPDITAFCRPAPSDFSDNQRQIFCVFSGKGVHKLRHYLMSLTTPTNSPQTDINDVLTKYIVANNLLQPSESLENGIQRISSELNQDSAAILAASGLSQIPGLNADVNLQSIPFQNLDDIFTWTKVDLENFTLDRDETNHLVSLLDRRFYEEPFSPDFEDLDPDAAPGATSVLNGEVCHLIRKFHELDERLEDFEVNVASLSRVQFQFTGFLLHEMAQIYVLMAELNRQTLHIQERVFSSEIEKDKKGFYVWRLFFLDRFTDLLQRYKIATIVLRLYLKDSVTLLTRQREAALANNRIAIRDDVSMNDRSATTISNNNLQPRADSDGDMDIDEVPNENPGAVSPRISDFWPPRNMTAPVTAVPFGLQNAVDVNDIETEGSGDAEESTSQFGDLPNAEDNNI